MKLERAKYLLVRADIERWILARPDEDPVKMVSHLALATSCPIIIVCQFVGELHGFTPELQRIMNLLMEFYQIDSIIL